MRGTGKEAGLSRDLETRCGALHSRVSIWTQVWPTLMGSMKTFLKPSKLQVPFRLGFKVHVSQTGSPFFCLPLPSIFIHQEATRRYLKGEKKKKASQVQVLDLLLTGSISYLIFPSHGQVFHLQNGHKNSPCLSRLRQRENKTTAVNHPAQSLTQELEAIFFFHFFIYTAQCKYSPHRSLIECIQISLVHFLLSCLTLFAFILLNS